MQLAERLFCSIENGTVSLARAGAAKLTQSPSLRFGRSIEHLFLYAKNDTFSLVFAACRTFVPFHRKRHFSELRPRRSPLAAASRALPPLKRRRLLSLLPLTEHLFPCTENGTSPHSPASRCSPEHQPSRRKNLRSPQVLISTEHLFFHLKTQPSNAAFSNKCSRIRLKKFAASFFLPHYTQIRGPFQYYLYIICT